MTLHVAFLWHMHQPIYLDPYSNQFLMPWVRLHGVRAYSDMISPFEDGTAPEECKVTFNLVPSLLEQIRDYPEKGDKFLELSLRPPGDLGPQEKVFILRHFFSCHWPTMVEPYERYRQLLEKRGRDLERVDLEEVVGRFSEEDIRDLQVWFNLTWTGFSMRDHPLVNGLFAKGRLYSEEEKRSLLDLHLDTLRDLISRYHALWQKGRIDISTSPYYHPILPLIIDTECAKRCMPDVSLPSRFSYPGDAKDQLIRAHRFITQLFQQEPSGLWPSEGGVSPELIPLAQEAGFKWMATDEAILHKSLGSNAGADLFRPYTVESGDASINMVFRHHELSDLIGFVYQRVDPDVAVRDFHSRLKELAQSCCNFEIPPLLVILLDGENPWEYYMDSGKGLLEGIYTKIAMDPEIRLTSITDYLEEYPPKKRLSNLYTGSWINSDFSIWIGGKEENSAWEELLSARLALENREAEGVDDGALGVAKEHIYAAEGSDWFWWYGDKFHTDFAMVFDTLFRNHLKRSYDALGESWPSSLETPIRHYKESTKITRPMGFINPEIDGMLSSYWEWAGAGSIGQEEINSMYKSTLYIKEVSYGFDLDWFYLKLVPAIAPEEVVDGDLRIVIGIKGEKDVLVEGQWRKGRSFEIFVDGKRKNCEDIGVRVAFFEILELAVPFALLGRGAGDSIGFFAEIKRNSVTIERWPQTGDVDVEVPDRDFERKVWLI